ncbi:MAG: chorismate-binding protein [Planctomycetota bacterium]
MIHWIVLVAMSLIVPEFERFCELVGQNNRVPVVATLICDELTPVGAFARLQAGSSHAFLLESVVGGEKIARYSFLGADPAVSFEVTRRQVHIRDRLAARAREATSADPLALLEEELRKYRAVHLPGLPRFLGGAVGYAGYDTVRYYERLPAAPADDRGLPDLLFDIYETLVIFDHVHKTVLVVAHAAVDAGMSFKGLKRAYYQARERIEGVIEQISQPISMRPVQVILPAPALERYASNFDQAGFERVVAACQEYIRAGDIFQVVTSQRLQVDTRAQPFDIYRALRVINPSPFMFYLKTPPVTLVGASPEVMCRVEDGVVTNRPLAGTRHRGGYGGGRRTVAPGVAG